MATFQKRGRTWRAQVCVAGTRRQKSFATRREAQAWAVDVERDLAAGELPDRPFADVLTRYQAEVSAHKRGARWEAARIGLLLRDPIAAVSVRALAAPHVAAWRDRRLAAVSGASVRREWTLLSHACTIAVREWHWLRANPFAEVRRPPAPPPRQQRIEPATIEAILHAAGYAEPPTSVAQRVACAFLFASCRRSITRRRSTTWPTRSIDWHAKRQGKMRDTARAALISDKRGLVFDV